MRARRGRLRRGSELRRRGRACRSRPTTASPAPSTRRASTDLSQRGLPDDLAERPRRRGQPALRGRLGAARRRRLGRGARRRRRRLPGVVQHVAAARVRAGARVRDRHGREGGVRGRHGAGRRRPLGGAARPHLRARDEPRHVPVPEQGRTGRRADPALGRDLRHRRPTAATPASGTRTPASRSGTRTRPTRRSGYQATFDAETQLPGIGVRRLAAAYVALSGDGVYCSVFRDDVVGAWTRAARADRGRVPGRVRQAERGRASTRSACRAAAPARARATPRSSPSRTSRRRGSGRRPAPRSPRSPASTT